MKRARHGGKEREKAYRPDECISRYLLLLTMGEKTLAIYFTSFSQHAHKPADRRLTANDV